jgi:hypothetical protein
MFANSLGSLDKSIYTTSRMDPYNNRVHTHLSTYMYAKFKVFQGLISVSFKTIFRHFYGVLKIITCERVRNELNCLDINLKTIFLKG